MTRAMPRRARLGSALAGALLAAAFARGQDLPTGWIDGTDAEADRVLAAAEAAAHAVAAADRRSYLAAVGQTFGAGRPRALHGDARRRCVRIHMAMLAAPSPLDVPFAVWFALEAAAYLAADNQCDGAIEVLDEAEQLAAATRDLLFERTRLRVDCLVELQQLGAAEVACAAGLERLGNDLERAGMLAHRGSVNVMLGRLDLAARDFDRSAALLSPLRLAPATTAAALEATFDLLLRQLDLFSAREQFDRSTATIAAFERDAAAAGHGLTDDQRLLLAVHAAATDYHRAQHDPAQLPATAARLAIQRQNPNLPPRLATLLTVWLADVELQLGHLDVARELLSAATKEPPSRRIRWLHAPIAARLARTTDAPPAERIEHERTLRAVLAEMIACWNEVAWDQESTGFLRLGSRVRVLAELIAVTVALHGPEQALQDVLDVQRCTTVSRVRAVPATTPQELRAALGDGFGALVFVPAWNESHAFAVDRERVTHTTLPRANLLRESCATLVQELPTLRADGDDAAIARAHGAGLALRERLLPEPLLERLSSWRGVTITGASLLGGAPLECLPLRDDRLLGERLAVATIGSLPLFVQLRRNGSAELTDAGGNVRLLASLTPGAAFAARNESPAATDVAPFLAPLLDRLSPADAVLLDTNATVAAWRHTAAAAHAVTMLLAHGERPLDGMPPALALTPDEAHADGLLTPADVQAAHQRGLVVLAACESASGPLRMGDDDVAASLAGSFLLAGANAVIASTGPQRLSLSIDLLAALLDELRRGPCAAEALRRARVALATNALRRWSLAQTTLVGCGELPVRLPPAPVRGRALSIAIVLSSTAAILLIAALGRRCVVKARCSKAAAAR